MRFNVAGALAVLGLAATAVHAAPNPAPAPAPVAAPGLLGIDLGLDLNVDIKVVIDGHNAYCRPLGGINLDILGLIRLHIGGFTYNHPQYGYCYCWYY
ncbi:hypothetical protein GQ42DRAFT_164340 [Ramicandelaber brevisporus]|nr:hypothetical protein GQ42DRAFT_164340 [Ramicandelaber brevisporus]